MKHSLSLGALLVGSVLFGQFAVPASAVADGPSPQVLGLLELRRDFHLAGSTADYDLMRSLWTDDAVFNGGGNHIEGGDAIADFFAQSAGWGTTLSLTSEGKLSYEFDGNVAELVFECIIVSVPGDPMTTSLSSIPPGSQNPDVEIVQHSHAKCIVVRQDGRWKFLEFNGSAGPLIL